MATSKPAVQEEKLETTRTISRIMQNNKDAKLHNVLAHLSKEELMRDVERFCEEKKLSDEVEWMKKGALVAQAPHNIENITELTQEERDVLLYEKAHRWHHPKMMYATIFLAAIGAATQGWDQTGSNGANLSFPVEFDIARVAPEPGGERDEWIVGVVNGAPYIASAVCGAWLSDPLNNLFGRRGCIFITACCLVATPIGSAFTHSWEALFAVRFVLGLGMGAKGATVPIFAAENSPPQIRGALVMGWQLWTAFGIFLGFCANVIVAKTGAIAWRLQLGSAFIPAFPLMLFIFLIPESARWLMKKNRYPEAWRSLTRLRFNKVQAARDMYYAHVQLVEEQRLVNGASFFHRFVELFTVPRLRRATWASGTVMLAQQMCGINIIAFYSSTVFVQSGFDGYTALFASLGFGAVNWLFAFPAIPVIDTFGRRNLLLSTFPNMAWSLLAAGLCFLISPNAGNGHLRLGMVATFIYIFAAFYSVGEGPVPFAYSAEVFPLSHREVGMAWAVAVCLGFSAVLTITYPRIQAAFTPTGAFGFYAGLNVLAFVMIFHLVPETKARTLEELDQVFSTPHKTFVNYQYTRALPYFVRRWIRMDKSAHLEPLFSTYDDLPNFGGVEEHHNEKAGGGVNSNGKGTVVAEETSSNGHEKGAEQRV